jgi:capsular polysaccharide biosynthesis protein
MKNKILIVIATIAFCLLMILLCLYVVKITVKKEANKAKTELVEKVKSANINDSTVAKSVAKTIHKFAAFKNKVKNDLKDLDSADSVKK